MRIPVIHRWVLASAALIAAAGLAAVPGAPAHASGPGQTIYDNYRASDTQMWQGWEPPAQPAAGWYDPANEYSLSAAADYNGNAQFVIWDTGTNGVTTIYHTIRAANGSWQSTGWGKPAMPSLHQNCAGSVAIPTWDPGTTDLHLDALCHS